MVPTLSPAEIAAAEFPGLAQSRPDGKLPGMKQFSLRRLLVSFTLVAVGLFMALNIYRYHGAFPIWFINGGLIFGGIGNLFRRPIVGAVVGMVIAAVLAMILFAFALRGLCP